MQAESLVLMLPAAEIHCSHFWTEEQLPSVQILAVATDILCSQPCSKNIFLLTQTPLLNFENRFCRTALSSLRLSFCKRAHCSAWYHQIRDLKIAFHCKACLDSFVADWYMSWNKTALNYSYNVLLSKVLQFLLIIAFCCRVYFKTEPVELHVISAGISISRLFLYSCFTLLHAIWSLAEV